MSAANAGPTPSHVYTSAGARTVTLTVTDADGTLTADLGPTRACCDMAI